MQIRSGGTGDLPALGAIYREALPEEDLLPLMAELLRLPAILSLVATEGPSLLGHAAFTPCQLATGEAEATLLGPLAVAPDRQRQGIGSALVRAGLDRLGKAGPGHVFVLGDPSYYRRFGFAPERNAAPPYPLPRAWAEAWQSLALGGAGPPPAGTLRVPAPWRRPALWAP